MDNSLIHLNESEQRCVRRYVAFLSDQLVENFRAVWLFGSAARGDMWHAHLPMHSDIDLLVLTDTPVPEDVQEDLVNETYPLFLESGRQLSPQFRTTTEFDTPPNDRSREFAERVKTEGKVLHSRDDRTRTTQS